MQVSKILGKYLCPVRFSNVSSRNTGCKHLLGCGLKLCPWQPLAGFPLLKKNLHLPHLIWCSGLSDGLGLKRPEFESLTCPLFSVRITSLCVFSECWWRHQHTSLWSLPYHQALCVQKDTVNVYLDTFISHGLKSSCLLQYIITRIGSLNQWDLQSWLH